MSVSVTANTRVSVPSSARIQRFRLVTGWLLITGTLASWLGLAWDFQWHSDVGPDTFFTLPHLVLYSGVALAGLTCLSVVLATTLRTHQGSALFPKDSLTSVFGIFHAPVGFILGGVGSAIFLLYGLYDEWWHGLYGFDVTIYSPPHVGLLFGVLFNMIGCVSVFSAAVKALPKAGLQAATLGLSAAVAVVMAFATAFVLVAASMPLGQMDGFALGTSLFYPLGLLLALSITRTPGTATLTAGLFTLLRLVAWVAAPWVTRVYAAAIGLPLRDYIDGSPAYAGWMPAYLLLGGLIIDLAFQLARRRGWSLRWAVPLAGALAALVLELSYKLSLPFQFSDAPSQGSLANLVLAALVGAFAGWLGWALGALLRKSAQ